MRTLLKSVLLVVPLLIIVLAAALPMPLRWSVGGMIFGLLFFQLALVGSFEGLLPNTRVYLALRDEVDKLLKLVRELNAAAIEARQAGMDPGPYVNPIITDIHAQVDRLPDFAGIPADGRLHLTPLSGDGLHDEDEVVH